MLYRYSSKKVFELEIWQLFELVTFLIQSCIYPHISKDIWKCFMCGLVVTCRSLGFCKLLDRFQSVVDIFYFSLQSWCESRNHITCIVSAGYSLILFFNSSVSTLNAYFVSNTILYLHLHSLHFFKLNMHSYYLYSFFKEGFLNLWKISVVLKNHYKISSYKDMYLYLFL